MKREELIHKILVDLANTFGSYDCYLDIENKTIGIIYNEMIFIKDYIKSNEKHINKITFDISKSAKEIFEERIEEFKQKAIERARKTKYLKDKLINFRLAKRDEIYDNILSFDVWGFERELVLRAYIFCEFEINEDMLMAEVI